MYCPENEYEFDKDLANRLRDFERPAPGYLHRWALPHVVILLCTILVLQWLLFNKPNRYFNPEVLHISLILGFLGIWRFGWWFTHSIRAAYWGNLVWPGMRQKADDLWLAGWRPKRLHVQMTTYYEEPSITKRVIGSMLGQVRREGIPTTIYIGTGSSYDENIIREFVETYAQDIPDELAKLVFVRQNQPGKRMAIGLILRAMCREEVDPDDLVIFMDGDALYGGDVLQKCLPMFAADPELGALTTDEEVICYGPDWIARLLDMRFAQRRLAMQSHALAGRVLTLTGRMSVFRAKHILTRDFIRNIEADHLDHWLWGRFRFLSGDDKSSWYRLLSRGVKMTYVPDATVYTIEVIKENGLARMVENFRRWSGNMLRNGARAIALGPRRMPFFIWWCVVDQRIAMWTMMVSPIMALFASFIQPGYFWNCIIWLVFSRLVLSLFLFGYSRKADMSWPFILYLNQVINATVKIYMIFHLSKQKWSNRGNQSAGGGTSVFDQMRNGFALFQLFTAVGVFFTAILSYMGLLENPFF